ncbi:MAG TPA: hypothetical protein VE987_05305 [Polyangiaceae bacterium]|nr:hypothetical protein [Polyangiaceae bacterium]
MVNGLTPHMQNRLAPRNVRSTAPAHRGLARALALALAAAIVQCACGGPETPARAPGRPVPAYEGHEAELFDDTLDPKAVGYELEHPSDPMTDALLRERTQVGDAVVRARVTTVTSKDEDKGLTWQIGLHTIERLAGTGPLANDFTVELGPRSPSAGIVRAWEGRLIGMRFITFVREFERPGSPGDTDLHFHLAPDRKEEAAAIRAAALAPVR